MDARYSVKKLERGEVEAWLHVCLYYANWNCEQWGIMICGYYMHVQVRVPELQARSGHRAAAFLIAPALTLVTIFGGNSSDLLSPSLTPCANTTLLEFGESTCIAWLPRSNHPRISRTVPKHLHVPSCHGIFYCP